jgi:hypothetical protein
VLKVQPGTVPVCHFLPQDHLVWVSKWLKQTVSWIGLWLNNKHYIAAYSYFKDLNYKCCMFNIKLYGYKFMYV